MFNTLHDISMKTQTRRPLGGPERFFWLLDQQRPVHFTMAATVTGTQPITNWQQALAAIQQQHPLFSVCIRLNENNSPEFVTQSGNPIPLKVVKTTAENAWVAELEYDTTQRFDSTSAPLVRVAVYEFEKQSVIALTAHHAISDGRSLTYALRDLLNAMNGKYASPYVMPPSIDSYTDLPENAVNGIPVSDEVIAAFKQPPVAGANPQIQLLELSKELSSRIILRSKQEGTTVHGTLCAALALASRSWKPNPIRLYSPASARETLGTGETSCLSIAGRVVPFDMDTIGSFWETARYAKETLIGANSMEDISGFAHFVFSVIKDGMNVEKAGHFVNTVLANEYLVTNVGSLPFDTDYGQLKLDAIWGPFTMTGYEDSQTVGIATINGSIRIAFTSLGHIEVKPVLEFMEQILSMECIPLNSLSEEQSL
jgi:hypothetical protein